MYALFRFVLTDGVNKTFKYENNLNNNLNKLEHTFKNKFKNTNLRIWSFRFNLAQRRYSIG